MPDMMPDRLAMPPLPTLRGESVLLRGRREPDIDDRVREPIDPDEYDAYGSSWRREWDGRAYHDRDGIAARFLADEPDAYTWAVEYQSHCIGGTRLRVNRDQHRAIRCYLACGFRREGVRRQAELYPDGWRDFIEMALLDSEYARISERSGGRDLAM